MPPAIFARVAAALSCWIGPIFLSSIGHPMTYRLCISDTVKFQVKLSVNDAGTKKDFSLWLDAQRVSLDTLQANIEEHGEMKLIDFQRKVCRDNVTGWNDQRLVVGDDGQPASYSESALDLVLGLPGAPGLIHAAYMEAIAASAGAAGRAKNS